MERERQPADFATLAAQHRGELLALALRMGAGDEAEDAVQEALLRAWEGLPRFRGEARFSTWLRRIAINAVLMRRRARRRHPCSRLDDRPDPSPGDPPAERIEEAWRVRAAVERLPEIYRLPVLLHDLQGLPGSDAADILALPPATFRVRLHRAHAMLRAWLARAG